MSRFPWSYVNASSERAISRDTTITIATTITIQEHQLEYYTLHPTPVRASASLLPFYLISRIPSVAPSATAIQRCDSGNCWNIRIVTQEFKLKACCWILLSERHPHLYDYLWRPCIPAAQS